MTFDWGLDLSRSAQGAGGVGGLLAVTEAPATGTGNHFYAIADGNGNVGTYLDAAGTNVAHYEYDSFGREVVRTGEKVDDFAHRFSTKYSDQESGLLYYGYRYYDPVTGRWPSRDPIEEDGGLNLYGMVGNKVVNWWDYLGLSEMDCDGDQCCINGGCIDPEEDLCSCLEINVQTLDFGWDFTGNPLDLFFVETLEVTNIRPGSEIDSDDVAHPKDKRRVNIEWNDKSDGCNCAKEKSYDDSTEIRTSYTTDRGGGLQNIPMAGKLPNGMLNLIGGVEGGGSGSVGPNNQILPEIPGKLTVTVTAGGKKCYESTFTIK